MVLAGAVQAQELDIQQRPWGFGWDGNPTVRRQLGAWQLAVTAGPDVILRDYQHYDFDPGLPDSLVGFQTDDNKNDLKGGTVGLDVLREVARQDNLVFSGLVGGTYQWGDIERWSTDYYPDGEFRDTRISGSWDRWTLRLGGRMAWYPVPFVSLETAFGLAYSWYNQDTQQRNHDYGATEWTVDNSHDRTREFDSFGFTDLTTDVNLVVWF